MKKKPLIALYADSYNERTGQSNAYITYFSQFGHVILIHSEMDLSFVLKHCDVLALPGGADVYPMRYGEFPHVWCGRPNAGYEFLDEELLTPWLATKKPIIGICRGLQTLNVVLGGSLHQHVYGHALGDNDDRGAETHEVYTNVPGHEVIGVNSFHHQAIKVLGEGLEVLGWSLSARGCPSIRNSQFAAKKHIINDQSERVLKSKGNYHAFPEIIKHTELPYIAFQYHPEEFDCPLAEKLINETLSEYVESKKTTEEKTPA